MFLTSCSEIPISMFVNYLILGTVTHLANWGDLGHGKFGTILGVLGR